ncbi:MAG TPA: ABC transporter ATP-binding protein [Spirochaetia bacterium]|nr:MAG: ABC transporter ATP-binding protein [Spirochaetes bacterium GWB1_36_13]HCL57814.1 ABC transporter ATP-binding protein [Spirochaetia bacterium]
MLEIKNLSVEIENKKVLNNINLKIPEGETHILFGPNGSGKTSLIMTIIGYPQYKVTGGSILFKGEDITSKSIEYRAKMGIGLAYQNPPVIKGLPLKKLVGLIQKENFKLEAYIDNLKMRELYEREINLGFSGGEKKRSELLQILAQNPDFLFLDEPESGVDIENMDIMGKVLAKFLEREHIKKRKKSGLIITHTGYILDYMNADKGYILIDGHIGCDGNPYQIFEKIKTKGFQECNSCLI